MSKYKSDYEVFTAPAAEGDPANLQFSGQRNVSDNSNLIMGRYDLTYKKMKNRVPGLSNGVINRKLNSEDYETLEKMERIAFGLNVELVQLMTPNAAHANAVENCDISKKSSPQRQSLDLLRNISDEAVLDHIIEELAH